MEFPDFWEGGGRGWIQKQEKTQALLTACAGFTGAGNARPTTVFGV